MKKIYLPHLFAIFACVGGLFFASCDSGPDKSGNIPPYDPTRPIKATSFHPTMGPLAAQVFIEGENLGNDISAVRVWFNEKQAPVISVKGKKMLVLAPKMPGEECIISVAIGQDSVAMTDVVFDYIIQTTVTTLVGGQQSTANPAMTPGFIPLSEVQFNTKLEHGMVIDSSDNIFITVNGEEANNQRRPIYMLNEKTGMLNYAHSPNAMVGSAVLAYNSNTDNAYWMYTNIGSNDVGYFDHTLDFTNIPKGNIDWDRSVIISGDMAPWGARTGVEFRPSDGKFYSRFNEGQFTRFDPETLRGENLSIPVENNPGGTTGNVRGLLFDPVDDNILYLANEGHHCIYRYNIETQTNELFAGQINSPGHADGERLTAKFDSPQQICMDSDGNIYVADRNNHCIRRISAETGYVSTVAGVPRVLGYVNGTADVAQFKYPMGLVIDSEGVFYIGDSENYAIRRLAIE